MIAMRVTCYLQWKWKKKTFHLCSIMPQSIADKLISPQPIFFYEISNLTFLPSANAEILTWAEGKKVRLNNFVPTSSGAEEQ